MSDSILLTRDGGLARVTFNRPAYLNAMDFDMGTLWRDIAHEVTSDASVGAVILDAAGPAFCAGGDVVAMATSGAGGDAVTATAHVIHDGIRTFALSDKPIVAAVQGAVAGGGLGLMLTADYIVASEIGEVRQQVREHRPHARPGRLDAAAGRDRPAPRAAAAAAGPHAERRRGARLGSRRRGRAARRRRRPRRAGRAVLARERDRRVRAGQAPRARRRRPHRSRRTSPTRPRRSARASTPTSRRCASPPSPRHPASSPPLIPVSDVPLVVAWAPARREFGTSQRELRDRAPQVAAHRTGRTIR